jgi:hypothetical protein
MKRMQTQQMIPIGKTHRINLGRIAPNSVLAMYITSGSLADDVFHPETVIASTLVNAYTIGEHFFLFFTIFFKLSSNYNSLLQASTISLITCRRTLGLRLRRLSLSTKRPS